MARSECVRAPLGVARASTANGAASADAVALLIADAVDALHAYEALAARLGGSRRGDAFETPVRMLDDDTASAGDPCRAALIGVAVATDAPHQPNETIERLARAGAIEPGGDIYLIAIDPAPDAHAASGAIARAREVCAQTGCTWCGGVAVGAGASIPRLMRSPRLGAWRRPVSCGIDWLVAAMRMGCALGDLAALAGPFAGRTQPLPPEIDEHAAASIIAVAPGALWQRYCRVRAARS